MCDEHNERRSGKVVGDAGTCVQGVTGKGQFQLGAIKAGECASVCAICLSEMQSITPQTPFVWGCEGKRVEEETRWWYGRGYGWKGTAARLDPRTIRGGRRSLTLSMRRLEACEGEREREKKGQVIQKRS